uniref:SH2 domain-containing protein n=1 Tax=Panagrellus redivivus TaxID=6233 RepID=A0A7E4ZXR6_PANRE
MATADSLTIKYDGDVTTISLLQAKKSKCGDTLAAQRWYWGNATREMIDIVMHQKPEGSFCIRDCSDGRDFTMTLKVREENRYIRIHCINGKCGFNTESLEFNKVVDLVDDHQDCALTEYNPDLNVPLSKPICRVVSLGIMDPTLPVDETYTRLYFALKCHIEGVQADFSRIALAYNHFTWRKKTMENYIRKLQKKYRYIDNLEEKFTKYVKEMEIARPAVANWVRDRYLETMDRCEEDDIRYLQPYLKATADQVASFLGLYMEQTETMERDVLHAMDVVREWIAIGLDQGIKFRAMAQMCIDTAALVQREDVTLSHLLLDTPLYWDAMAWLSVNKSKEVADKQIYTLMAKNDPNIPKDGIFLIRPSGSDAKLFVLSISCGGKVHHCYIEYRTKAKYGEVKVGFAFKDTDTYVASLTDFVRFYSRVPLKDHNPLLTCTLAYPVFTGYNALRYV